MLQRPLGAATGIGVMIAVRTSPAATPLAKEAEMLGKNGMRYGTISDRKISRLILGSNMCRGLI